MNWKQSISNAPYNTLNLPTNEEAGFNNPAESNLKFQQSYKSQQNKTKPETENNFYDPTTEKVNDYLKSNTSMYDNRGKYFDNYLFNQKFDQYIKQENKKRLLKEKVNLYDLNTVSNIQIAPYQLPINKLLINLKNVWSNFFDNLMNLNNPFENFDNTDLFYYGITLVSIYILIIMLSFIFD